MFIFCTLYNKGDWLGLFIFRCVGCFFQSPLLKSDCVLFIYLFYYLLCAISNKIPINTYTDIIWLVDFSQRGHVMLVQLVAAGCSLLQFAAHISVLVSRHQLYNRPGHFFHFGIFGFIGYFESGIYIIYFYSVGKFLYILYCHCIYC